MQKIKSNVPELLEASGCKPFELVRVGLSQGTAYAWANDNVKRCDFSTLALLCQFFTEKLGHPVRVGDILEWHPSGEFTDKMHKVWGIAAAVPEAQRTEAGQGGDALVDNADFDGCGEMIV